MSKDDFEEWKASLVTQAVLKYLQDLVERDCEYLANDFRAGALHLFDKESMALNEGKAIARLEVADITLEEMEEYYEKEREPDQDSES